MTVLKQQFEQYLLRQQKCYKGYATYIEIIN